MSDHTLDFIGKLIVDMRVDLRELREDMQAVKRDVAQLRDEQLVNTAWLMRDKAEPIAAAALQSQLQRMNSRMDAMERRVGAVEGRLPAE